MTCTLESGVQGELRRYRGLRLMGNDVMHGRHWCSPLRRLCWITGGLDDRRVSQCLPDAKAMT